MSRGDACSCWSNAEKEGLVAAGEGDLSRAVRGRPEREGESTETRSLRGSDKEGPGKRIGEKRQCGETAAARLESSDWTLAG